MKKVFYFLLFLSSMCSIHAQIKYSSKIEGSSLLFLGHTISVDPGENWKGYYLERENGWSLSVSNGIKFSQNFYAGIGLSYLNFKGIQGVAYYLDTEILTSPKRFSYLINVHIGRTHVWNSYAGGTGTGLFQLSLGGQYKLTEKLSLYTKVGIMLTQQSALIPITLGIRL